MKRGRSQELQEDDEVELVLDAIEQCVAHSGDDTKLVALKKLVVSGLRGGEPADFDAAPARGVRLGDGGVLRDCLA